MSKSSTSTTSKRGAASKTDWARVKATRDTDIDLSDMPEITPEMAAQGVVRVGGKVVERGKKGHGKMANKKNEPSVVALPVEAIAGHILLIRNHKVLLDADLAELYDVPTKVLVQAVKRNLDRFPEDFMFQLNAEEWEALRSQIVTSNAGRGGRRYAPYAFTEQGVAMLSTVLSSPRAIAVNIEIMRAFVRLRETLASNKELAAKLEELERKLKTHDQAIAGILDAIRQLMAPPDPKSKRPIGFVAPEEKKR